MADAELKVEGDDSFALGSNSFLLHSKLRGGEYVSSMNTINRGGIIQTRPGSASLILNFIDEEGVIHENTDISGSNLQGMTMFTPTDGATHLVFMVDGLVYASPYPFKKYFQLRDLEFSKYSKYAAWASCVQSTDYDSSGNLIALPVAKAVLIIQDGSTRAAYWDGANGTHINPTESGNEFTIPDRDGTPVGLWMKWSNNRLWVSRKDRIYASDIGNPLKFTETQFLNEVRAFILSGECTGMIETPDRTGLICFTKDNASLIQSGIQDRILWLQTPGFFRTILPDVGCVSPRSLLHQHGMIWWMTPKGLINLDDAQKANVTSKLIIRDQQMSGSKETMSHDVTMACGSCFENFLFHAVPVGHKLNTRLHVMDQAQYDNETFEVWPSYWEGWRPVEFAGGVLRSEERVFCLSKDYDGVNRIWELFLKDKTDNGIPITCFVQTKLHLFENRDYKSFRYAEVEAVELSGNVSVMIAAAGMRGGFQVMGVKDIVATNGQVYADVEYGDDVLLAGSRVQTRIIRTNDKTDPSECNSECIEDIHGGLKDKGFSLMIAWQGKAGFSSYRIIAIHEPDAPMGRCEESEVGEVKLLTSEGCGSTERISGEKGFTVYEAEETVEEFGDDETASATSIVSQEAASQKAIGIATWKLGVRTGSVVLTQSCCYEGIIPIKPRAVPIENQILV